MSRPYKRRRSASVVRNLWVYRRMVLAAVILGLTLWFILVNNTPVSVRFPFGLGPLATTSGVAILMGAAAGAIATASIFAIWTAMRRLRPGGDLEDRTDPSAIPEDRPPTDYAAKAKEGFSGADWSA